MYQNDVSCIIKLGVFSFTGVPVALLPWSLPPIYDLEYGPMLRARVTEQPIRRQGRNAEFD